MLEPRSQQGRAAQLELRHLSTPLDDAAAMHRGLLPQGGQPGSWQVGGNPWSPAIPLGHGSSTLLAAQIRVYRV